MKKNILRLLTIGFILGLFLVGCASAPRTEPAPAAETPPPATEPAPAQRPAPAPASTGPSAPITTIGEYAFPFHNLTSIVIPDSVTSIGRLAFYGNPITDITIGDNVELGSSAFLNGVVVYYFNEFYESNGRKKGRYTYRVGRWTFEPIQWSHKARNCIASCLAWTEGSYSIKPEGSY